jgi:hypothetical protein
MRETAKDNERAYTSTPIHRESPQATFGGRGDCHRCEAKAEEERPGWMTWLAALSLPRISQAERREEIKDLYVKTKYVQCHTFTIYNMFIFYTIRNWITQFTTYLYFILFAYGSCFLLFYTNLFSILGYALVCKTRPVGRNLIAFYY